MAISLLLCGCTARGAPRTVIIRGEETDVQWLAAGDRPGGLDPKSGGDGVVLRTAKDGAACISTNPASTPRSQYLYFARSAGGKPVGHRYVAVEYYDAGVSSSLALHDDSDTGDGLDAKYRPAEDSAGGAFLGTHRWKRAYYLLRKPLLAHRQNNGADFRITGGPLFIRSVRLLTRRPSDWNEVARIEVVAVKPLVHIGAGGQLIVGGFDPAHPNDAPAMARSLESAAVALKQLGVTNHEGYVRWNLCEPREGVYDWSVYDQYAKVCQRQHLKWVPFLIVGSAYSLPDWYYKKPGSLGYVCLEHGQESDAPRT